MLIIFANRMYVIQSSIKLPGIMQLKKAHAIVSE